MRLFVSINFNDETRERLVGLQNELRKGAVCGRFVTGENLHLTLAFLGDCDSKQIAIAKAVLGEMDFEPFGIVIDNIGRFRRDGGDIWWAGVANNRDLLRVQKILTDKLAAAGFKLDKRKYSPHITLGREVVTRDGFVPRQPLAFGEEVLMIELMRSERRDGKMVYTPICCKEVQV